ncbi:MAG TPA: hypothetical protein VGJ04_12395, partial [Pirellulales bacterium]
MKQLNIKLLSILAIVVVVLTGSVVAVHGIQMNRNIDSLLKRAEAAKKDDMQTALTLFQRYRTYKPNDLQRNAEFATLLAEKAQSTLLAIDYGTAHSVMIQAMTGLENQPELKSTLDDLQHKLIELNITFHELGQARDDLLKLKAKGQGDAKTDMQLAQCYISTVEFGKARELLETLIGYDSKAKTFDVSKATAPKEIDAYWLLANLFRDKLRDEQAPDRIEMADRVIDQLVKVNSESARAFLMQAQYLASYQTVEKARPAVARALELAPDDAEVLLHATELALQSDESAKAETYILKGIEKYPKDWRFYRLWAQLAEVQKNPAEAKKRIEKGLEALPTNLYLLDLCFDRQIRERDFEGARVTLKKLTYARLRQEYRDYGEARLLMAEGNMLEASQLLEQLQPKLGKIPQLSHMTDVLLVQCYTALNQPDRLLNAARRIPNTPEGQIAMAIAEQSLGQGDKALKRYEGIAKILEENKKMANMPQLPSAIFQLRLSDQLHKPKEQRDWKEVEELLAKMRDQKTVQEPAGSLMQITLLSAKGEKAQAQQVLDGLLKSYPNDVAVLMRAVGFALQDQKADRAMQIIESASPEVRNNPMLIAGRVEAVLVGGGKPEEIKSSLQEIERSAEKLPTDDRVRIFGNLGMASL